MPHHLSRLSPPLSWCRWFLPLKLFRVRNWSGLRLVCWCVCVCVCFFFPLPLGFCGRGGRGGSGIDDIGGSFCGGRGTGCLRRCVQYLLGVLLWWRPCHRNPRTFFFLLLLLFPLFCLLFAVVPRYWNSVVCLISVL
jgi:hypothetical protein